MKFYTVLFASQFWKRSVLKEKYQKKCFVQKKHEDDNTNRGCVREQKDDFICDSNVAMEVLRFS